MAITREMVEHVARLAGLSLTDEEMEEQTRLLSRIVDYMDRLQEVSVEGVAPLAYPWLESMPLRADEPRRGPGREELLDGAPAREGPYLLVPLVVDRGEEGGG